MATVVNYDFLNWHKMSAINEEKIRADLWKLEFIRKPAAIPFPPDEYIQSRLTAYDFSAQDDNTIVETVIRGFSILQTAPPGQTSGSLSLQFEDFSDQTLTYCFREWKRGCGDYATRMSLPQSALTADIAITITDVNKVPIRVIRMYGVLPEGIPFGEHGGGDGNDVLGTLSVNLRFAYWEREILNVNGN